MTIHDLLRQYCKYRILRPATVRNYAEAIRNLESFFLATARQLPSLQDLCTDDMLEHRAWCIARMSGTSYNTRRRHLRALFNFAITEGHVGQSPLAKVLPAPVGSRRPKVVPTSWYRRAAALLEGDAVAGLNPTNFWKVAISVIHFTGMRRRQLVELCWEDVLWARGALLLRSDGSKSRREWVVPLPRWLMQELKCLKVRIEDKSGVKPQDSHQVFDLPLFSERIRSRRMTVEHVSRAFEALSRHLGYMISAHRVRHTSATAMLNATGHLKGVSDMLGHSDIKLTASTYVHPSLRHLRKVQAVLGGYKLGD